MLKFLQKEKKLTTSLDLTMDGWREKMFFFMQDRHSKYFKMSLNSFFLTELSIGGVPVLFISGVKVMMEKDF